MRRFLGIALVTLTASAAAAQDVSPVSAPVPDSVAQPATVAGVNAFLQGDYAHAAEILRPLVEAWPAPVSDGAAAFFLGSLYDAGLGVPQDRIRACALYERAGAGAGPLAAMARATSATLRTTLSPSEWSDCVLLRSVGTGHRFEPVLVAMADDYWVSIDLRSSPSHEVSGVVSLRGKEKRTKINLNVTSGMVFLPVEFTELQVGGVAPGPRRFVEVAAWVPAQDRNWHLEWAIVEVVGADLVPVTSRSLSMAAGPAAPDDLSLHLRDLVDLHVNEAGEAEWAILGPDAEHQVIETNAMRQEIDKRDKRRKAANERVNWERRRDADREPSLAYTDADGCRDVLMYGWTAERAEWIAVRADKDALQLSTTPRTFDLGQSQVDIEVVADVFEQPHGEWGECSDATLRADGERQETWRAVGGTLTIQLSSPGLSAQRPGQYRTTVQIDNAEFMSSTGARVRSPRPIRMTAMTGSAATTEP